MIYGDRMRVLGFVFSARERGNCYYCVNYCLEKFREHGFETQLINAYDYVIKPCSHCNYECFSKELEGREERCPIKDDLPKIYNLMEKANILIFGIPCYAGHASGLYRAFSERMASLGWSKIEKMLLNKLKGFIVVGNLSAWGDLTLHEVLVDFYNAKIPPEALLLQALEYGRISLKGDLIEEPIVKKKLEWLVNRLIRKYKQLV